MDHVDTQVQIFALTMASGILVGVLFDSYRFLRKLLRLRHQWMVGVGDGLFWLLATASVFVTLLYGNYGEVRFYVFLGMAIGFTVYMRLLSRSVRRLLNFIYRFLHRILVIVVAVVRVLVVKPVFLVLRLLWWPLWWMGHGWARGCTALKKRCKFMNKPPQT